MSNHYVFIIDRDYNIVVYGYTNFVKRKLTSSSESLLNGDCSDHRTTQNPKATFIPFDFKTTVSHTHDFVHSPFLLIGGGGNGHLDRISYE